MSPHGTPPASIRMCCGRERTVRGWRLSPGIIHVDDVMPIAVTLAFFVLQQRLEVQRRIVRMLGVNHMATPEAMRPEQAKQS